MKERLIGFMSAIAGILAFVAVASTPVAGQQSAFTPAYDQGQPERPLVPEHPPGPVPRTKTGKPDMQGHWVPPLFTASNILEEHAGGFGVQSGKSVVIDPPDGKIPYQPWALAQRDENRKPENAYLDNEGQCVQAGVPRIMLFAFDIWYTPGYVNLITEHQQTTRIIPVDGRPHLPPGIRLYMGDPVGRWERDTLVIDSTNFNGKSWIALGGDFYTENAHTVERLTMTDSNTLKYTITITDPKAFTRPWTMTTAAPFMKLPGEEVLEDTCHEGNVDLVHLKNNYDAAHAKPAHR